MKWTLWTLMHLMLLKIAVLNVRGVVKNEKFERLKETCKKANVILLQETNWREEIMEGLKKKWSGDIFYNNGDGRRGRGVAILIKRGVGEKIKVVYDDKEGKCIAVKIEGEECLTIFNIHAPVIEKEKVLFFRKIKGIVASLGNFVIMGDFNTIFSKMDITEGMVFKSDSGRKELKGMMEDNDLVEVWRERNEGIREFSRQQLVMDFMCRSRIDFILSKRDLVEFIDGIYYKETFLSDHKILWAEIDMSGIKRGPGLWMLNTEILKTEEFCMELEELMKREMEDQLYNEDKRIWWDNMKYEISKCTKEHSRLIQKAKKGEEYRIRRELKEEQSKDGKDSQRIIHLEEKIKEIEERKCKGAMVRSRAKYIVEGEKCTKFFFNMEKNRQRSGMIKELRSKDGEKVTETQDILKEIKDFYEELFRSERLDLEHKHFFEERIKARVDDDDKKLAEKEIGKEEIEEAIMQLSNGKSPGRDGIPNEFYKVFSKVLIPILKEVYEDIFKRDEMSNFMGIGLIKLIYKKRGDIKDLRNYRPITMLNSDFKILAKILANRLKLILPNIIQTNQAYAIRGRDITDTISSIRDVVSFMIAEKKRGYVISLDLEKAFDRVEHQFLFGVLKQYGFGENFIKWIKILYKDVRSQIKCNGFVTDTFKLTRSIRQGCPLSALLYSLVAEALGLALKEEKGIKGI